MTSMVDGKTGRQRKLQIEVGKFVLAGGSWASLPGDWFLGQVLWADDKDLLIHRGSMTGTQDYRQHIEIDYVRASGTIEELVEIQRTAREEVKALADAIYDAEQVLSEHRKALWNRVRELAKGGLKVSVPTPTTIQGSSSLVGFEEIL